MSAGGSLVVRHARLATMGAPQSASGETPLGVVEDGALVAIEGRIAWLGPDAELPLGVAAGAPVLDVGGRLVTPGLVDCHTHLCFDGERSGEFEQRAAGATYLELAAAGGGILSTVRATRAASDARLAELLERRLQRLASWGVTTCEVKSGYELTEVGERRLLGVIGRAGVRAEVQVRGTLLALHALPPEFADDRAGWVRAAAGLARARLAPMCDAFVERGAFTADEARAVFAAAREAGSATCLHADQLSAGGGAGLAAELGCRSAAHLERVDAAGIEALAKSGTVAVLLPTATWFIRERTYAPGRALMLANATIALATNANPGTAMTENVGLALTLAVLECGLTPAQALWAFTRGGAAALGLADRGRLAVGLRADLACFDAEGAAHLAWHAATPHLAWSALAGVLRATPGPSAACHS